MWSWLKLFRASKMTPMKEPKIVSRPAFKVAGMNAAFSFDELSEIPMLWQKFMPSASKLSNRKGTATYGVMHDDIAEAEREDVDFAYLACVEVSKLEDLPPEMEGMEIPAGEYAVFTHTEGLDTLSETMDEIWSAWLPMSGYQAAEAPCFEYYDERFDPKTLEGAVDIYFPIKRTVQ